jgi:hypothetical protein
LTQDLNGFLHELDVSLGESSSSTAASSTALWGADSTDLLRELFLLLISTTSWRLLLRTELADDLDTTTGCRSILSGTIFIIILLHQLFGLFNESAMLFIPIVLHAGLAFPLYLQHLLLDVVIIIVLVFISGGDYLPLGLVILSDNVCWLLSLLFLLLGTGLLFL